MIKVTFYKRDRSYIGFSVVGHAGYDKIGKDIICAAVSALTINTINSIDELTDDKYVVESKDSGALRMKFTGKSSKEGQLLIRALRVGLVKLYEEYGNEYLQLYFKEV